MTDPTRPASWYADPTGRHRLRYWNGIEWTEHVADGQQTSVDPPTPDASGAAADPTAPAAPAPMRAKRVAKPVFGWLAALGGVLLAVGAFLDAVSATAGSGVFGVTIDQSYLDGDGPIELVLGIVILALGVLVAIGVLPRWGGWIVLALGVLGAIVAVVDLVDVQDKLDQIRALGGSGSIGPALWVCLAGGVVASAFGAMAAISTTGAGSDAR